MRNSKPILVVDDDSVDVMAAKRAMRDAGVENQVVHRENGEDALDYLRDSGSQEPCLILLDLNMPKMNGIEFLRVVKDDESLRRIPVLVLTTSNEQSDVVTCFELGAAGYMLKSIDYEEFSETIKAINRYWTISESPIAVTNGTNEVCVKAG
jgi:CheY-like chemotaxis protein